LWPLPPRANRAGTRDANERLGARLSAFEAKLAKKAKKAKKAK